jgi:hypothetical protein
MHFRSYIFVIDITEISIPFLFLIISYYFCFQQNNLKVKVVEPFSYRFRSFSALPRRAENVYHLSTMHIAQQCTEASYVLLERK